MLPSMRNIAFLRTRLLRWFKTNARNYPWRHTLNPWRVLIAEMMLQRTKADQVEAVYRDFFRKFKTPYDIANAKPQELRKTLFPLGLKWRITNFRSLSQMVESKFSGHLPKNRDVLRSLPGVGDYVAGAVMSIGYRRPEWIVDSNVVRIFKRFFGIATSKEGRRDKQIVKVAKLYSQNRKPRETNLALLDFAALICTPRNPQCLRCPVRKVCKYFNKAHRQF